MLLVSEPNIGLDEIAALRDVVDSGWITMGDRVNAFELAFAEHHETPTAVAVSSCTAALHLALEALGVGPGDEVLVPSLTFVATVNAVLYTGATPVFVDIDSLDWPLISISDAAAKCTAKTRAVIVMHYAGYVAGGDSWRDFTKAKGLYLIEDAAHAAGIPLAGKYGDAAAFSFYGNKNMTTAEGGMIVAAGNEVLEKTRRMRGHGMTSSTFQRFAGRSVGYDVTMLGYNYRMDELRAAIGLVQIKKLSEWNNKRRHLTGLYMHALRERCPDVGLPFNNWKVAANQASSHHIMPIVLPEWADRNRIIEFLRDAGIQTSNHYPPVHQLSYHRSLYPNVYLPRTEDFARRQLTLPLHPKMEEGHVEQIATALGTALQQAIGSSAFAEGYAA